MALDPIGRSVRLELRCLDGTGQVGLWKNNGKKINTVESFSGGFRVFVFTFVCSFTFGQRVLGSSVGQSDGVELAQCELAFWRSLALR